MTTDVTPKQPAATMPAFQRYARFVSVDPGKNRYRFYVLRWHEDLFGQTVLARTWGRLGTRGNTRLFFVGEREQAAKAIERLVHHRALHGYELVESD